MRYCLLFFLLGFTFSTFHSQILEVNKPIFTDEPFFNTNFIKNNRIKTITGSISSKKVQDIIRSNGLDYHYTFNKNGTLKSQLSSHFIGGNKDSSTVAYEYDHNLRVSRRRKSDIHGYYSHHYKYDKRGNVILQSYSRDQNSFNSKDKFKLKNEFMIVTDSFSYHPLNDAQLKKIFYNAYGKPYKEQINDYDTHGYLTQKYTKFIIGSSKKKLTYEYDERGRLFKKHVYTDIVKGKKTTEVYSYDDIGNVLEVKYFKDDKHLTTKQFLYDKETLLLTATITQEIDTEFLRIVKYRYSFYDDSINLTEFEDSLGNFKSN